MILKHLKPEMTKRRTWKEMVIHQMKLTNLSNIIERDTKLDFGKL